MDSYLLGDQDGHGYANIVEELLLALVGFTGDVFEKLNSTEGQTG